VLVAYGVKPWDGVSFDRVPGFPDDSPAGFSPAPPEGLAVRALVYEFDMAERAVVGEPLYESPRIEIPPPAPNANGNFERGADPPVAITVPVFPLRPLESGPPVDGPRCVARPGQEVLEVCRLFETKSYIFILTPQGASSRSTYKAEVFMGGGEYPGYDTREARGIKVLGVDNRDTPDFYTGGVAFCLLKENPGEGAEIDLLSDGWIPRADLAFRAVMTEVPACDPARGFLPGFATHVPGGTPLCVSAARAPQPTGYVLTLWTDSLQACDPSNGFLPGSLPHNESCQVGP
jgi:hypothetical protein